MLHTSYLFKIFLRHKLSENFILKLELMQFLCNKNVCISEKLNTKNVIELNKLVLLNFLILTHR